MHLGGLLSHLLLESHQQPRNFALFLKQKCCESFLWWMWKHSSATKITSFVVSNSATVWSEMSAKTCSCICFSNCLKFVHFRQIWGQSLYFRSVHPWYACAWGWDDEVWKQTRAVLHAKKRLILCECLPPFFFTQNACLMLRTCPPPASHLPHVMRHAAKNDYVLRC